MRYVLGMLMVAALLTACGSGSSAPVVSRTRPERVQPGGLLLVSGERLARVTDVTIAGVTVAEVTHVNDTLLSLVAPAELPSGRQMLMLHVPRGTPTAVTVEVGTSAVAPPAVQAPPAPTPTPAPTQPPAAPAPATVSGPRPAPPPPPAPPKKDDKKPGNGNGRGR